jgi:hypothetical protein
MYGNRFMAVLYSTLPGTSDKTVNYPACPATRGTSVQL